MTISGEPKLGDWKELNEIVAEWDEIEPNEPPAVKSGFAPISEGVEIKRHRKKKKKSEDEEAKDDE